MTDSDKIGAVKRNTERVKSMIGESGQEGRGRDWWGESEVMNSQRDGS